MKIGTILSLSFGIVATFCILATLFFVMAGFALSTQDQIEQHGRATAASISKMFNSQCSSIERYLKGEIEEGSLLSLETDSREVIDATLQRIAYTAQLDEVYAVRLDTDNRLSVIGESLGVGFPGEVNYYRQFFDAAKSSNSIISFGLVTPTQETVLAYIASAGSDKYWILGFLDIEKVIVPSIASTLDLVGNFSAVYTEEYTKDISNFFESLIYKKRYGGVAELRNCSSIVIGYIMYSTSLEVYRNSFIQQVTHTLIFGIFFILAAVLVGISISNRIVKVLKLLEEAADGVGNGNKTNIDENLILEEAKNIVESFNRMSTSVHTTNLGKDCLLKLLSAQIESNTETLKRLTDG